jgi:hypothetical protein
MFSYTDFIALTHILNFIKDNNNTNIILLNVSHRHDLMDLCCVNNEIRTFSRKLMTYIKFAEYTVLEINQNGIFYTSWTAPKWTREKKVFPNK